MSVLAIQSTARRAPKRVAQRGLTMIEMMVSITIGLLIVGATLYVYLSSRGAYGTSKSTSRTQEAGRFGLDAILSDIRQAGFIGCGSRVSVATNQPVVVNQIASPPLDLGTSAPYTVIPVGGYSATSYAAGSTNPWPSAATVNPPWVSGGGDVLVLRVAASAPLVFAKDPDPTIPALFVANNCSGLKPGQYLILSSCSAATVLRISAVAAQSSTTCPGKATQVIAGGVEVDHKATDAQGNTVNLAPGTYAQSITSAFPVSSLPTTQMLDTVTYYVGQLTLAGGTKRAPALYRYSAGTTGTNGNLGVSEEIIDHVEKMSVYYGIDPGGGNPVYYLSAANVPANLWSSVTSVRVQLLTAAGATDQTGAEKGTLSAPQAPLLFGAPGSTTTFTPTDTRYYQVFTATAALRDKLQ